MNANIKNHYAQYTQLVGVKTTPLQSPLTLSVKPSKGRLFGSVALSCAMEQDLHLAADKNVKNVSHYGIKVRAPNLFDPPIIRFDADGAAHINEFESIPLSARQVTTPHFHRFNEDGIEFAYKTGALNDPQTVAAIQKDINLGLKYFSQEANISSEPVLSVLEAQISLLATEYDPTAGLHFS